MRPQYLTYGILPDYHEYAEAWERAFPNGRGRFSVVNDPYAGTDEFSRRELWDLLNKAVSEWDNGDEQAGAFASAVLSVLGFEWV